METAQAGEAGRTEESNTDENGETPYQEDYLPPGLHEGEAGNGAEAATTAEEINENLLDDEEDESIAWDKLRGNLARWRKEPLAGFLVHGSNGEFAYLTPEEREDVIRVVKEEVGEGQLVLAGSGCESTCETIEMTSAMADAGADAAVVYTPCYYKAKMTSPALEKHFIEVADPVPYLLFSIVFLQIQRLTFQLLQWPG